MNFKLIFEGKVQQDFWPPVFSSFELACTTDQWIKIFSILITFRRVIWIFRGIILRGVMSPFWILCKGTVQRDFWLVFFLHNSSLPELLSNGLKYFRFRLRFRRVIQMFHDPSHFLKFSHTPWKGQCHKNKCGFLFY